MGLSVESHWVLEKTPKGREELVSRANRLPAMLRSLLVMSNGQRTAAELARNSPDPTRSAEHLSMLLRDGYLQPATSAAASPASGSQPTAQDGMDLKSLLIGIVAEVFGPQPKLVQKIEAANDSVQALEEVVQASAKYAKLFIDAGQAAVFLERAKRLFQSARKD